MHDETPQSSSHTTPASADKEWAELQRDLDTLGAQLAALRTHTATLGEHVLANLQAQYEDVKSRAATFRVATETQIEAVRQSALQQAREAEGALKDAQTRSTETARDAMRQMWERSEPLRQGARDVGEGLGRAWSEIIASFGKAAGRLQSQSSPRNGTAPVPTGDDRRETT